MADVSPGQLVTLTDGRQATVRFVGTTHFSAGDWIGIELDEPTGKNDGSVQGERYFDCEAGFGMFVRPAVVAAVMDPPPRESKQPPKSNGSGIAARGRPPSGVVAGVAGARRPSTVSSSNIKRNSSSAAASPSPAPKVGAPRTLRSPTKSPTKQLSMSSTPLTSTRSSISGPSRTPSVATKARPTAGTRTSMGPPAPASVTSKTSRSSLSGPSKSIRPGLQPGASTHATLAKRPTVRPTIAKKAPEGADSGVTGQSDDAESPAIEGESPEDGTFTPQASRRVSGSLRTGASRPGLSPGLSPSQRQAQSGALTRELDELKTKLKVMEKKRAEDREKLKALERLQAERDKFEGIIQKLQAKYQPQQLEIGDLRKKLKDAESRLEEVERLLAEHDSILEMAALDREMAEETADAYKHECEALRQKVEELQLEVEVLREENEEMGHVMSPEEKSSQGWLQMEKTNERLREALIRLRDMTQQQEADLRDQIKELEQDLEEYAAVKSQYEATKEKLMVSETNVEDLKQQLETALGAEEMIEELADKNMRYQEEINELKAAIEDLEALKEINDELEYTHIETEKQLQEEIDYRDTLFSEQSRRMAQQDELIEDLEYTLSRFRELVSTLQSDLEDMRASQQISEAEATDLTARSRAMMDLNMKLQASVAKAQTKTIDLELDRMESEEAAQHLAILKLYLPEYFDGERNSILALLRFKRVSFKASLMISTIRERVSDQSSISAAQEELFTATSVLENLLWVSSICDRFVNYISTCPAETFGRMEGALFEMEPVERTLNFWIESLKKNEMNMNKCAVELQRSIALLSHLAETLLPPGLETFADELCMGSILTLSYLDHSASSIARVKQLIQGKLASPEEDDGESAFLFGKMDTFVSQARGLKVAMGKISRSLEDLRSRSLALSNDAADPFKKTEDAARDLSDLARQIGENLAQLVNEEGRTEPFTLGEFQTSMSQTLKSFVQSSESGDDRQEAISSLSNRLRILGGNLEELDSISSDLTLTTEFERHSAPWIARSEELRSNKTISPDADEEIRRLKNEIHEASTALGVKDKTLEEQAIKVELLESRMREASKKASMVKELESKIEEMRGKASELESKVEKQSKEIQALETERDEYRTRFEKVKRVSGTAGIAATADGMVVDAGMSLATMRENEGLRAEVESLQAAVRFLREENRRNNMLDPYSVQRSANMYAWLDAPLTQAKAGAEREKIQHTASESRDVLAHLLKLAQDSRVCDLKSMMPRENDNNRAAWRPTKSRLRYQVLQQRENFERWAEWKEDIVSHEREQDRVAAAKKERTLREQARRHARFKSELEFPKGLGHGMMGRAWQILGMQRDDDAKANLAGQSVGIVDIHSQD